MFVREKRFECGKYYEEVDIIPRTVIAERAVRGKRAKRKKVSRPVQTNINDKNSKRYLKLLANGNFENGDYMATFTYWRKYLPNSVDEAEKEIRNYLKRLARKRKKLGLDKLKYILITEYKLEEDGKTFTNRIHHHLFLNSGVDRDEMEKLWSKKLKGEPKERIGLANIRSLQFNENGIEGLAEYVTKERHGKKGSKRWSSSQNLKKPILKKSDYKFTASELAKMANSNDMGREILEKKYKNHFIASIESVYYELTGWHIYLKMWKKSKFGKKKKRKSRTINYGQKN
ncbi:hypothetical protein [Carnobacterium maltaromaticum]|uniref:hypothetical protein n=1 Tax=Carnobacterium maltaromaticum TaxID=2751 RepID=UPI0039BE8682